ncbi:hypothetical protein BaRGS_00017052 [Batillaria attramentaria]|uniref:Uncharacterized protein n=1 Tax=Batillaria attramentaria TaxID=370345 RepID=A0ABD0KXM2_9CAEN
MLALSVHAFSTIKATRKTLPPHNNPGRCPQLITFSLHNTTPVPVVFSIFSLCQTPDQISHTRIGRQPALTHPLLIRVCQFRRLVFLDTAYGTCTESTGLQPDRLESVRPLEKGGGRGRGGRLGHARNVLIDVDEEMGKVML